MLLEPSFTIFALPGYAEDKERDKVPPVAFSTRENSVEEKPKAPPFPSQYLELHEVTERFALLWMHDRESGQKPLTQLMSHKMCILNASPKENSNIPVEKAQCF